MDMTQYHISLPDPAKARGTDGELAFTAHGAEGFAEQLQDALRSTTLSIAGAASSLTPTPWKTSGARPTRRQP